MPTHHTPRLPAAPMLSALGLWEETADATSPTDRAHVEDDSLRAHQKGEPGGPEPAGPAADGWSVICDAFSDVSASLSEVFVTREAAGDDYERYDRRAARSMPPRACRDSTPLSGDSEHWRRARSQELSRAQLEGPSVAGGQIRKMLSARSITPTPMGRRATSREAEHEEVGPVQRAPQFTKMPSGRPGRSVTPPPMGRRATGRGPPREAKDEDEDEAGDDTLGPMGPASSSGDGKRSGRAPAPEAGRAPQEGPSVPGRRLRTILNGGPPQRSAQEAAPAPVGRRDTGRGPPVFEAAATPAALLGAGLVVDQEPLLGAGLLPVRTRRESRESQEEKSVQFRETNSCFSGGGTRYIEDMSDRQQPRPTPRRGSGGRRQRSSRGESGEGRESGSDISGSEKAGSVFQKIYEDLAGGGA